MKIARLAIVVTTLLLAGFAGTDHASLLQTAACQIDAVAGALAAAPPSSSCAR
jgi:hypothetical protein